MTKRERETRFLELTSTYSVRSMADLVIQLEEHCEKKDKEYAKKDAEIAKLKAKIQEDPSTDEPRPLEEPASELMEKT